MMPTLLVYLGCLALYPALVVHTRPFGVLDVAAILISSAAIWIEARADQELWQFRTTTQQPGAIIQTGLWKYSRHPNYLGEMAFWWGLYLFALAAAPRQYGWTVLGPISITCLFLCVSIPMIERRMLERRPEYTDQIETTSKLIPWPPRDKQQKMDR
jgi:steroid 5-alpha reductase family enzyme